MVSRYVVMPSLSIFVAFRWPQKCVQALFGGKFNAPSSPIFKQLGIPKVP